MNRTNSTITRVSALPLRIGFGAHQGNSSAGIGTYDINDESVNKGVFGQIKSYISQTIDQADLGGEKALDKDGGADGGGAGRQGALPRLLRMAGRADRGGAPDDRRREVRDNEQVKVAAITILILPNRSLK